MYADTSMAGDATGNSGGNMNTMRAFLENSSAVVCIGPEGGWSEAEIQWWHAEQAQQRAAAISLGENILKTETAAVVAAAYMCRPISL
jgi:RsmE family RNA methyltransferase